jgi:hypothetical protein
MKRRGLVFYQQAGFSNKLRRRSDTGSDPGEPSEVFAIALRGSTLEQSQHHIWVSQESWNGMTVQR